MDANPFLGAAEAQRDGVEGVWSQTNEQWWDWYMSLAVNREAPGVSFEGPSLPDVGSVGLDEAERELAADYSVKSEARERFWADGYVRLDDVVSAGAILGLRRAFLRLFLSAPRPAMGFPSLEMMWTHDAWSRAFVLSRRLAGIAGQLLDVDAVRIYHDNALAKLPGCGRTPWHYDAHHYPIASDRVVTAWLPLQPTSPEMGPLEFARGIDTYRLVEAMEFDKVSCGYDAAVIDVLEQARVPLETVTYDLGSVTFHHTHSLHSAGPNRTDMERMALATTYFESGARLTDRPTIISGDFEKFMPGVVPGAVIDSDLNPVVWSRGQ